MNQNSQHNSFMNNAVPLQHVDELNSTLGELSILNNICNNAKSLLDVKYTKIKNDIQFSTINQDLLNNSINSSHNNQINIDLNRGNVI